MTHLVLCATSCHTGLLLTLSTFTVQYFSFFFFLPPLLLKHGLAQPYASRHVLWWINWGVMHSSEVVGQRKVVNSLTPMNWRAEGVFGWNMSRLKWIYICWPVVKVNALSNLKSFSVIRAVCWVTWIITWSEPYKLSIIGLSACFCYAVINNRLCWWKNTYGENKQGCKYTFSL